MDINTKLDAIKDDNGIYCIERIGRQFWHYILDHPFYHHDALKQKLGNMHVICLAPCVDGRCKAPIEDIQNAVDGAISDEQTIKLRQCLNHIDELENHKKEIEREIFRLSDKYDTALNLIRTVPGFDKNPMTAIQVLSESGGDMSVFPTAKNLVSWAGCETVSSFV
jgi:transposase